LGCRSSGNSATETAPTTLSGSAASPVWSHAPNRWLALYRPRMAAHRDAANATMIDFDDVHLLREAEPGRVSLFVARSVRAWNARSGVAADRCDNMPVLHARMRLRPRVFPEGNRPGAGAGRGQASGSYVTEQSANAYPLSRSAKVRTPGLAGRVSDVQALRAVRPPRYGSLWRKAHGIASTWWRLPPFFGCRHLAFALVRLQPSVRPFLLLAHLGSCGTSRAGLASGKGSRARANVIREG